MASIPTLQSSSISKNIMDSQNCLRGSARLVVLAQQLRLYNHPPIDTDIEEEEEKELTVEESAGKVASQVGFAESATPVANQPKKLRPKRAAVLIFLFEGNHGDLLVILTKRSSRLSTHSGQ